MTSAVTFFNKQVHRGRFYFKDVVLVKMFSQSSSKISGVFIKYINIIDNFMPSKNIESDGEGKERDDSKSQQQLDEPKLVDIKVR